MPLQRHHPLPSLPRVPRNTTTTLTALPARRNNITTTFLPPPTPLPMHPDMEQKTSVVSTATPATPTSPASPTSLTSTTAPTAALPRSKPTSTDNPTSPAAPNGRPPLLTTAATTFALKAYLTSYLHALGWDPCLHSAPEFINHYAWLLGAEMSLPAPQAAQIFLEIFEATTPTMGAVCQAILGMREKLECSEEAESGLRRLWERNQGVGVEEFVRSSEVGERVGVGVVKSRRRVGGGLAGVVNKVMARSRSIKKKENGKG